MFIWASRTLEVTAVSFDREEAMFKVVVNHEQQYSIWPADEQLPASWREVGMAGSERECLAYIDCAYRDMRSLSLQKFMDNQGG